MDDNQASHIENKNDEEDGLFHLRRNSHGCNQDDPFFSFDRISNSFFLFSVVAICCFCMVTVGFTSSSDAMASSQQVRDYSNFVSQTKMGLRQSFHEGEDLTDDTEGDT
jgi:hypothetical protein